MALPRLYLLDLDGALYKSDALWRDFRELCENRWGINEHTFMETYDAAKTPSGVYDIDGHLHALGIAIEDTRGAIAECISRTNYAHDDVAPFFTRHAEDRLIILTQGVAWFQHMKASAISVPNQEIEVITTLEKKRDYITSHIECNDDHCTFRNNHYAQVVFVDNMAQAFIPPEATHKHIHQYRLKRAIEDDRHSDEATPFGIEEITTLDTLT